MRPALALLILLFTGLAQQADSTADRPFLLTDRRLKRLKLDRTRQTERWMNFEARVKSVPDSPERGFELALYARVTSDNAAAVEAMTWAKAHPCERRQVALIKKLTLQAAASLPVPSGNCPAPAGPLSTLRDSVFEHISDSAFRLDAALFLKLLRNTRLSDAAEIYAATEILMVVPRDLKADVREQDAPFFNSLPVQFLLSLKPQQVEHPEWMTHVAALGLVALDPNSDSSQFLQGWAIEDRHMLHDGPGMAYELLWADPYLPGVGYQNLDPWYYDEAASRLLARTDWSNNACSIAVSPDGIEAAQCSSNWQSTKMDFGHLALIPFTAQCVELPARPNNQSAILWKLSPNARLKAMETRKVVLQHPDRAGLWRVPSNIVGKVCSVR